jgi:hypothetical protein
VTWSALHYVELLLPCTQRLSSVSVPVLTARLPALSCLCIFSLLLLQEKEEEEGKIEEVDEEAEKKEKKKKTVGTGASCGSNGDAG